MLIGEQLQKRMENDITKENNDFINFLLCNSSFICLYCVLPTTVKTTDVSILQRRKQGRKDTLTSNSIGISCT